ncbi:MAG: Arm DNA-binding domain-containing protein, partial [Hyphomicrobiaceae bacterium]
MPRITLTDYSIKALSIPDGSQVEYWDMSLRTFGVRVAKGGSKTFVLKRGQQRFVLGRYPAVSLKEARAEAHRRLALKYFPSKSIRAHAAIQQYLNTWPRNK